MAHGTYTGYIHTLLDHNLSFEQFVWYCARQFGALVEMRDEANTAVIDFDKLLSNSSAREYHEPQLTSAIEKLARLKAMSAEERTDYGSAKWEEQIRFYDEMIAHANNERAKLSDMLARVDNWTPPSGEHEKLKEFMVDQISRAIESCTCEYAQEARANTMAMSAYDFYANELWRAEQQVEYHEEELAKSSNDVNGRAQWLKALLASVPYAPIETGVK